MDRYEYQVTAVSFGLGLQTASARTERMNEHVGEVASQGWRLVTISHNAFEFPITWRYFWERPAG